MAAARGGANDLPDTETLWTFLTAISGIRDELERARLTATWIPSVLSCRVCGIGLAGDDDWRLIAHVDGETLPPEEADRAGAGLRPFFEEAFQRPPFLFLSADGGSDPPLPERVGEWPTRHLVLAPLMTRHHQLGVVLIGRDEDTELSRGRQVFLSILAEQLAVGIENLRLHQELAASAARFESLYNDTPVMMHSIGRDHRLISVNDHWLRVTGYTRDEVLGRGSVEFLTEESRHRAVTVDIPRMMETGSVDEAEYQMVAKDGRVIDVLLSARFYEADESGFGVDRSAAFIVDVTERKRLQRALQEAHDELEAKVEERTAELRESRDHLGELNKRQRVLLSLNEAMSSHLRRDDLCASIAAALRGLLVFDRLAVFTPQPDTGDLQVYSLEAETLGPTIHQGAAFPVEGTVPGWALEHHEVFVGGKLEDYQRFPVSHRVLEEEEIESICAVPLVCNGDVIGVMVLYAQARDAFTNDDVDLLREIGDAVALALDRCLVYEEIEALKAKLEQENVYLREQIQLNHNFEEIVGASSAIRQVLEAVETVAPTHANVLITGETGTGKELIARAVHNLSERSDRPLIKVNCATIPKELFESEFFGHVKGAFTGALKTRAGRFELADQGTLFLDEVGEIPLDMQSKLLRVLQEGEFERVGEETTRRVDVRVIAATNRDLDEEVEHGRFRQDLYYRINVFPIHVAPLRERRSDIPMLAAHFLERAAKELKCEAPDLLDEHAEKLAAYDWPGNVRELQNVIERAIITSRSDKLRLDLPEREVAAEEEELAHTALLDASLADVEKAHILRVFKANEGNKSKTARELGIDPKTLYKRLREYGVLPPRD